MSEIRTAVERLDALLAGLEEDVLRASGTGRGSLEEVGSGQGVKSIRSDIEEMIRSRANRMAGRKPVHSMKAHSLGAKAKVTGTMARLWRWVGAGLPMDDQTSVPRVRMAFSGATPEKREKDQRGDAGSRKDMPNKETESSSG